MSAAVDASVLVAALIESRGDGPWERSSISRTPLAAPELVLVEAASTLRRLELSRWASRVEAAAAHRDLLRLGIELYPFAPFADRVWELRTNLTGYDAWYVAVAESLSRPLITLDHRMSRADGPICEMITPPAAS